MQDQMHYLWGVPKAQFKWLPLRFYFYLSRGKNLKRIYFGEYLERLQELLWAKDREYNQERLAFQRLSFDLIDFDQDGVITSKDFVFLANNLDQGSHFNQCEI